ncbi:MAG: hypothetical protein ACI8Q1_003806, partial [Parvicella sp.]
MQNTVSEIVKDTSPLFENDTIVFGVLMLVLGIIFFTSAKKFGAWNKFYKIVP